MEYHIALNSLIVSRQTAGANGNVCRVNLPGGIEFRFAQLGAYYPNWEILQRKGVKIDVEVSSTIDDIREGRDVWIKKVIEIIERRQLRNYILLTLIVLKIINNTIALNLKFNK